MPMRVRLPRFCQVPLGLVGPPEAHRAPLGPATCMAREILWHQRKSGRIRVPHPSSFNGGHAVNGNLATPTVDEVRLDWLFQIPSHLANDFILDTQLLGGNRRIRLIIP